MFFIAIRIDKYLEYACLSEFKTSKKIKYHKIRSLSPGLIDVR